MKHDVLQADEHGAEGAERLPQHVGNHHERERDRNQLAVGSRQKQRRRQDAPQHQRGGRIAYGHYRAEPQPERHQASHRLAIAASLGFGKQPGQCGQDTEVDHRRVVQDLSAGEPQAPRTCAEILQRQGDDDEARHNRQRVLQVIEDGNRRRFLHSTHGIRERTASPLSF